MTRLELQKLYAIGFLVGFFLLTMFLIITIIIFAVRDVKMPEWAVQFLVTVWMFMMSKIGTAMDYFFGTSKGSTDKNETIEALINKKTLSP